LRTSALARSVEQADAKLESLVVRTESQPRVDEQTLSRVDLTSADEAVSSAGEKPAVAETRGLTQFWRVVSASSSARKAEQPVLMPVGMNDDWRC
jgi:hypothetical protein